MANLSELDRKLLSEIHALMREYGISRLQLLKILGCRPPTSTPKGPIPRPMQTYRNPYTGVCITVRSGRSLAYRAWATEFGEDVVASWIVVSGKSPADD